MRFILYLSTDDFVIECSDTVGWVV